jgi:hypothetical protein
MRFGFASGRWGLSHINFSGRIESIPGIVEIDSIPEQIEQTIRDTLRRTL